MTIWSGDTSVGDGDVGAFREDRMVLEHRPEPVERIVLTSSVTQKIACGLPIEATDGVCSTGASIGPIWSSMPVVSANSSANGVSSQLKRLAHIDADQPVGMLLGGEDARQASRKTKLFCPVSALQRLDNAAHPVAAPQQHRN